MYTGITGLWRQGVWLEQVPVCHITSVHVTAGGGIRSLIVDVSATCGRLLVATVRRADGGAEIGVAEGTCCRLQINVDVDLVLWSPEAPVMYEVSLALDSGDAVVHPFGLRHIAVKSGVLALNGNPIFMHGVLHQGYWPE